MPLNEMTIREARAALDKGEISAVELAKACLDKISQADSDIHACLLVDEAGALKAAASADQRLQAGERGDLLGIPYLCKDNIMTKGLKTTAASKILENYVAPYDATIIKRLREAGAVLLGKTNLDEFAHGASTENSAFGPTRNPRDLERVPGGSSGGSAAAVAAHMCLFALGSDTGGSIRQPASFCGISGFKPSYGRVSRFGLISMTSSTDAIGPLAKTAYDAALVLKVIAGRDERDATSAPEAVPQYNASLEEGKILKGLKIGLPKEYFIKELDTKVRELVMAIAKEFQAAGAELVDISLPYTKYAVPTYYIITPSEISSNLARFDGIGWGRGAESAKSLSDFYHQTRGQGFGPEVKRRVMLGTYALSAGYYDAYYKKAQAVRTLIDQDFVKAFQKIDLILTPTSPHPAFKLGEKKDNPLAMYLEDIFLTGASLAGLPAASFPAGEADGLPVGFQLIAPRLREEAIFQAAVAIGK